MEDLVVRIAEEKDVIGIEVVEKDCFSVPWSYDSLLHDITLNDKALYIVALVEGKVVGYAGLWKILDEGHITNVAVLKDYRGKSIGKALVAVLIDVGKGSGINSFTLEVRASNTVALNLYESMGFKNAGVRKDYYNLPTEDAIIMWKE